MLPVPASPPPLRSPEPGSPIRTLADVMAFDGDLLLDLDETLYLRNSTEDFIDCAAPGVVALLLLRLLDGLQPWRWTGGAASRDWWRLKVVSVLLPWTAWRWRRRVAGLAKLHGNGPLIEAVKRSRARPAIVTAGFEPVVAPLVAALGFGTAARVACSLASPADRLLGKRAMAESAFGAERVRASMVVTDSPDDQPLLDACRFPLLTVWPDARYRPALGGVYLPGQYLSRVKRPGERYIVHGILLEDFAFWVLASVAVSPAPLLHLAALPFLLLSFWAIYETGYVDNDRVARDHESDPKLSNSFGRVEVATPALQPWLWAAASGAIGVALLNLPGGPWGADLARWAGVLVAVWLWFRIYNRADKPTRIWLFPGLQLLRSAAIVALVAIPVEAVLALGAHAVSRWMPYFQYRTAKEGWPDSHAFLSRLMIFGLFLMMLAATQGPAVLLTPTTLALLGWNALRARREIAAVLRDAHRIDRPNA